jgi:hypothetical protein
VIDVIPLQRISGIKFKRRGGKGTPDREEYDARCLPTAVAGTCCHPSKTTTSIITGKLRKSIIIIRNDRNLEIAQ